MRILFLGKSSVIASGQDLKKLVLLISFVGKNFFLGKLIQDLDKLAAIPTIIVNGRGKIL